MPGDRFIELAMAEDRHVLDVLFKHAREAVTVQDQSGRLVYANDGAARMVGLVTGEEMIRAPASKIVTNFEMVDETGSPLSLEVLPGRRVLAGEEVTEMTIGYRTTGSRRVRWSRVNASPVKNDKGEVVWAINFFFDITDQVRRREGDQVVSAIGDALGGALDIEENLLAVADTLVPDYAGWCAVRLEDEERGLTSEAVKYSRDGVHLSYAKADRQTVEFDPEQIQARVMKTGRPELIPKLAVAGGASVFHDGLGWPNPTAERDFSSVACVPLGPRKTPSGCVTVARRADDDPFDEMDIDMLLEVAQRASVALANARLYQHEHETAEILQRGLTPAFIPAIAGLSIAARYEPEAPFRNIGGDFYDIVELGQDQNAIWIGDIEGKGVHAAAAVGLARHTLRATALLDPEPATVMRQLNWALRQDAPLRMCTLGYLVVDRHPDHFEMHTALAGHPPPFVVSVDGEIAPTGVPCPPLGLLDSIEPFVVTTKLFSGDTVVAYTDGYAVRDRTPPETLMPLLGGAESEPLNELLDRLMSALFAADNPVRDDVVLLAIRIE